MSAAFLKRSAAFITRFDESNGIASTLHSIVSLSALSGRVETVKSSPNLTGATRLIRLWNPSGLTPVTANIKFTLHGENFFIVIECYDFIPFMADFSDMSKHDCYFCRII